MRIIAWLLVLTGVGSSTAMAFAGGLAQGHVPSGVNWTVMIMPAVSLLSGIGGAYLTGTRMLTRHDQQLIGIDGTLRRHEARFERVDERINVVHGRINEVDQRCGRIEGSQTAAQALCDERHGRGKVRT